MRSKLIGPAAPAPLVWLLLLLGRPVPRSGFRLPSSQKPCAQAAAQILGAAKADPAGREPAVRQRLDRAAALAFRVLHAQVHHAEQRDARLRVRRAAAGKADGRPHQKSLHGFLSPALFLVENSGSRAGLRHRVRTGVRTGWRSRG
jgi:hypothetical protein